MTHPLKPYPAYRDSGLPWLGEVPEHWEVRRLKACVTDVIDMARGREPGDVYVALEHVESWTGKIVDMDLDTTFESHVKRFRPNDVLFGKLRPYLAKTTRLDREGVCVGEFLVLRPSNDSLLPAYLEILLRSKSMVDAIDASTFGAKMPRADWQFIGNMCFLLPPRPEQTAIVRYLDHVGERIGRYIGAKERLIALLKERRQAIIDRAVTRGLDPNAPMKPTGIAWMSEVPAHWETRRLKSCVTDVVDMTNEREPGDIYVALEHVESWTGKIVDVDFDTAFESQVKRFRTDDVLFGKLRPYLAKSTRPDRSGVCVGEFLVLRPRDDNLLPSYLEILLRSKSVVDAIDASTFGAKMPRADWQFIGNMRFPLPPVSEQAAIVERLERSTAAIDTAIDRTRRQIGLLREYRERLINDVVTGKLDVRGARVAAAPDADAPQESGQAPSHRAEAGAPAIP